MELLMILFRTLTIVIVGCCWLRTTTTDARSIRSSNGELQKRYIFSLFNNIYFSRKCCSIVSSHRCRQLICAATTIDASCSCCYWQQQLMLDLWQWTVACNYGSCLWDVSRNVLARAYESTRRMSSRLFS